MYTILLGIHVLAGNIALLSAAGAVAVTKGGRAHAWVGRAFALGMTVIFLTAVPMTVIKPNLFLLLVALFNFYLTATGWLRARNRAGVPTRTEWVLAAGESMGVVLVAFAGIGGVLALRDLSGLRHHAFRGKERIVSHLTRMLGGTVGAVTAFVVTNVRFEPAFVLWLFARERATYAATPTAEHMLDASLVELERKLDPAKFVRIHRSTLLNLAWVSELHADFGGRLVVRLKGDRRHELVVSRDRVRPLKERLGLT